MKIIFDTCIIQGSGFYADSYEFRLFNSLKRELNMWVYMPMLVLDELKSHLNDQIHKKIDSIFSEAKSLYKIIPHQYIENFEIHTVEKSKADRTLVDSLLDDYEEILSQQILHYYNRTIQYPSCNHEYVLSKIRNKKAPFLKGTEQGYKDLLIWLSVLEVATDKEPTVFVTSNTNDFMKDNQIHPDLLEDIDYFQKSACKITFYPSLKAFIDAEITPTLPQNTDVFRQIVNESYKPINLQEWCDNNLKWRLRNTQLPFLSWDLPLGHLSKEIYIYDLSYLEKPKLLGVYIKEDKNILEVSFEVPAEVEVIYNIHRNEFTNVSEDFYDIKNLNIDNQHPYLYKILDKAKLNFRVSIFIDQLREKTVGYLIWARRNSYNYCLLSSRGKTEFKIRKKKKRPKKQQKGLRVYRMEERSENSKEQ